MCVAGVTSYSPGSWKKYRFLSLLGVMENVLSLYPGQSWDTSILPVLSSYGEPFMDAVSRDSCDGHDVGRVSCFTVLIRRILGGGCPRENLDHPKKINRSEQRREPIN